MKVFWLLDLKRVSGNSMLRSSFVLDGVSNQQLQNIDPHLRPRLLDEYNEIWQPRTIFGNWRTLLVRPVARHPRVQCHFDNVLDALQMHDNGTSRLPAPLLTS